MPCGPNSTPESEQELIVPAMAVSRILEVEALMPIVIVEEGDKKSTGLAMCDDRPFRLLPRLVHIEEQRRRAPFSWVWMSDYAVESSLVGEVERRVDPYGIVVLRLGIPPDELRKVLFAGGDLAKGEEILLADRANSRIAAHKV
jgi:hypothetical protein